MKFKKLLAKGYVNFRGWGTKRRIVVIESDDWGSIRMASRAAIEHLESKRFNLGRSPFAQMDGLERKEDIEMLFELLSGFSDCKGNSPVVTALALVANPDFDAIGEENLSYRWQGIRKTYEEYYEDGLLDLWLDEGVSGNLLFPQFHGREHLHPARWLNQVRDPGSVEHEAFKVRSIVGLGDTDRTKQFMAAFEYHDEEDKRDIEAAAAEGLKLFREVFGFESKSFCPSQSIYGNHLDEVLKKNGVRYYQAGQQFVPEDGGLKKVNHFWGDRTKNGMTYWRRNCTFEPYKGQYLDHVDTCLAEMDIAFRCGKPAVINSHRINFTSRIKTSTRDHSLKLLEELITRALKKWPDIEFVNSAQLGEAMAESMEG